MSVQSFVGGEKKKAAAAALKQKPLLVLFYMESCMHCQNNKPAWEEAKTKVPAGTKIVEIEDSALPENAGIEGYPTMRLVDKSGKVLTTTGEKKSGDQLLKDMKSSGGRRRRTNRRRNRKLRYRTSRNHVSL
jgi:thioredoxin-related protein